MPSRPRSFLLPAIALSWLLLLLSALSHTGAGGALGGEWPRWTMIAAQVLLTLSIFGEARQRSEPLRNQNFLALLRGLGVGPGLLALAGAGLFVLERAVAAREPGGNPVVSNIV